MSVTAVPIRPVARGALVKLWIGIVLLLAVAAAAAFAGTRGSASTATASGLRYEVLKQGSGPTATASDVALIDYEGRLVDGTVFDASARHGGPQVMPVGGAIPGFTEGLQLMNKGARYRFHIPSRLAYGDQAQGGVIPANSDLVFDVTLHEFAPMSAMQGQLPAGR